MQIPEPERWPATVDRRKQESSALGSSLNVSPPFKVDTGISTSDSASTAPGARAPSATGDTTTQSSIDGFTQCSEGNSNSVHAREGASTANLTPASSLDENPAISVGVSQDQPSGGSGKVAKDKGEEGRNIQVEENASQDQPGGGSGQVAPGKGDEEANIQLEDDGSDEGGVCLSDGTSSEDEEAKAEKVANRHKTQESACHKLTGSKRTKKTEKKTGSSKGAKQKTNPNEGRNDAESDGGKSKHGPNTAPNFDSKNHHQDDDEPADYEVPDVDPKKKRRIKVVGVEYEGDTPHVVYMEGRKRVMSPAYIIWQDEDEIEAFGPQWKELCEEMELSQLTYQGKDDPEGRRRHEQMRNQQRTKSPKKSPVKTTKRARESRKRKKQEEQERRRLLHHEVKTHNAEGSEGVPEGGDALSKETTGGGVSPGGGAAEGENPTNKEGISGAGGNTGANKEGGGGKAQQKDGDGKGGSKKHGNNRDGSDKEVSNRGTDQAGDTSVVVAKRRVASQGHVNHPTPFGLPKATHGHGCSHSGVLDLAGFNQREYKHYIQEGRFLHSVGTCSGGCGTKFDGSYKARPMPSGFLVFGCPVGKRFCTKDKKEYDVECNFARCCLCQMKAMEAHEKETSGGGRARASRRAKTNAA